MPSGMPFPFCLPQIMVHLPPIGDSDILDGLNIGYLKFFGLWKVINDYRITGKKNNIVKFQLMLILMFTTPHLFFQCVALLTIKLEMQKIAFIVLHAVPALQVTCKILLFWYRLGGQCKLFSLIRKDFLSSIPHRKLEEINETIRNITKRTYIFIIAALVVDVSIVSLNIADPGVPTNFFQVPTYTNLTSVLEEVNFKIICSWYPLPLGQFPYYQLMYGFEMLEIVTVGMLSGVYACMYYQVLVALYLQFTILAHHISSLNVHYQHQNQSNAHSTGKNNDSHIYKELYKIIKDHQNLISYADQLAKIYNPLVTMILGTGVFVLIMSVFQFLFVGGGSPIFIFKSLQFVFYQVIEVSMFCLGSSAVETVSSDFQIAIYRSDWYKADIKYRKTAQLVMVRARKAMILRAIRLYPANQETMMNIFQFTYTVAALISRMTE